MPSLDSNALDNHLCDTLPTQRLAAHETLSLESGDEIAGCRKQQHDRCGDQARRIDDDAEPLDQAHGAVDTCAHVVGGESSDERVKSG